MSPITTASPTISACPALPIAPSITPDTVSTNTCSSAGSATGLTPLSPSVARAGIPSVVPPAVPPAAPLAAHRESSCPFNSSFIRFTIASNPSLCPDSPPPSDVRASPGSPNPSSQARTCFSSTELSSGEVDSPKAK